MLKRIRMDQLRLGMHVHELCGSWMDHPFWRSKFLLSDPQDLQRLKDCGIGELWIDTGKGLDVDGGLSQEQVASEVEEELVVAVTTPLPEQRISAQEEFSRASQICQQAKVKVQSLFQEARMGQAIHTEGCAALVDDIIASVSRNSGALASLVRLKSQDEYTYLHSVAVCTLMVALGRTLGLPQAELQQLGLAGLLHDMGKARVPLEVLNKPDRLTDDEFTLMKRHPEFGHEMLLTEGGSSEVALDVCLHHHERIDGTGYPHRLAGDQISLHARMGSVCDVYDAITSARPYKAAWDPGEAVRQMAQWKGHFDPIIFQAFVKTVGIYPMGSLVRLQSGRLGVVMDQNEQSLLAPRVKVFFSTKSMMRIPPEVIDLGPGRSPDRILSVESTEKWKFKDLDELWLEPKRVRAQPV
ncbi:putative nucleotidyltransferase with HDIG domain [Sphaerotilus hippei]|uniref:Putative nucleotidyltransferase with HDIG domain n=1 Tax=Sphaerotilus hippei TaxID=744406 RepID=A0A318H0C3_9BURK|nr:HD-GYP domain-containing protein [Sphaerotilus hippei]PXW96184.1 putative nucleotidyltransferase with HDIG domain [Sphaerotilus hippei]